MTLWQQLQAEIGRMSVNASLEGPDEDLLRSVRDISTREGCQPDEMILILLDQAVKDRRRLDRAHRSWDALSPARSRWLPWCAPVSPGAR